MSDQFQYFPAPEGEERRGSFETSDKEYADDCASSRRKDGCRATVRSTSHRHRTRRVMYEVRWWTQHDAPSVSADR